MEEMLGGGCWLIFFVQILGDRREREINCKSPKQSSALGAIPRQFFPHFL